MTVKELISQLSELPQDLPVIVQLDPNEPLEEVDLEACQVVGLAENNCNHPEDGPATAICLWLDHNA